MRALALGLMAWLLWSPTIAGANPVQHAGLSFISNADEIASRFPYSVQALGFGTGSGAADFDQHLTALVKQVSNPGMQFVTQDLGDLQQGRSRALSFAVSGESYEVQRFEGMHLSIYTLSAQLLFYELSTPQKLVASFPVRVRYTDLSAAPPTPDQITAMFRRMYFDPQHPSSLTTQWLARLAQVELKEGFKLLQVRAVNLEDKALAAMPAGMPAGHAAAEIAQFFESALSSRVGLPMVPYTLGHAIASKISARFANGNAIELEPPTADFTLVVTVREFRRLQEDAGSAWRVAYGSFVTLIASSSLDGDKPLATGRFRQVQSATLPKQSGIVLDDWPQHRQVLQNLLDGLAVQVRQPDPAWVATNGSTADALAQLNQLSTRLR